MKDQLSHFHSIETNRNRNGALNRPLSDIEKVRMLTGFKNRKELRESVRSLLERVVILSGGSIEGSKIKVGNYLSL